MINQKKVSELIHQIQPNTDIYRGLRWIQPLGLDKWVGPDDDLNDIPANETLANYTIQQAILGSIGNFNFWEEDGKITWPGLTSDDWFKVVQLEKSIEQMNMAVKRKELWNNAIEFMTDLNLIEIIYDPIWWAALSAVFGGDPLKKRETLLWVILSDIGFSGIPLPNTGCIDYNVILSLRYFGAITGYEGNIFNLIDETKLRFECLEIVKQILIERPDLTVSTLDSFLYDAGKYIRNAIPREEWDPYFCYRFGCFFY